MTPLRCTVAPESAALAALVAELPHDPVVQGLQVYVVGGAVRDALLGLPAGDRDWVVVGADPAEMTRRGFTPVGGDFPVFLHPHTQEEYALARTERKTRLGYKGFVFHAGPEVTLADDLQRRDLTVNAMALGADHVLHDPWGGLADIQQRCLRHVGPAFVEDPVRILRLARFAARFTEFGVASETLALCQQMVLNQEADALVPERVWREVSRGLMQARPQRMFEVLAQVGALARVAPEWQAAWQGTPGLAPWLQRLTATELGLAERYALLCLPMADAASLHRRLRVPLECADLARLLACWRDDIVPLPTLTAEAQLGCLERCDGLRKPERFLVLVGLAAFAWPGQVAVAPWQAALAAARAVDAGAVARAVGQGGDAIRQAVRQARLLALRALAPER